MSPFVALIAAIVLREKLLTTRKLGLSLLLAGTLVIVGWHAAVYSTSRTFGNALYPSATFLWARFTVVMRQAKIDPLHATALVSTGSIQHCAEPVSRKMPIADIATQTIFTAFSSPLFP
jgi:drug/metabolite transporter (DMT)-like permease